MPPHPKHARATIKTEAGQRPLEAAQKPLAHARGSVSVASRVSCKSGKPVYRSSVLRRRVGFWVMCV